MFICNCNAIRERHVSEALANPPEKTTPAQIYRAAAIIAQSSSTKPQCGQCMCDFKNIAACHNADKAMHKIKKTVADVTTPDKIPA
jgi:bacterioferritin-associated ferredoxin